MRNAGCRIGRLHHIHRSGALRGRQVALEERVVVDTALGFVREDGDGDAWEALHGCTGSRLRICLPGGT